MPRALALTWDMIKDKKISPREKYELLLDFDKVFGLGLSEVKKIKIPQKIEELAKKRENYRQKGDWKKADEVRKKVSELGYSIEDAEKGYEIKKD